MASSLSDLGQVAGPGMSPGYMPLMYNRPSLLNKLTSSPDNTYPMDRAYNYATGNLLEDVVGSKRSLIKFITVNQIINTIMGPSGKHIDLGIAPAIQAGLAQGKMDVFNFMSKISTPSNKKPNIYKIRKNSKYFSNNKGILGRAMSIAIPKGTGIRSMLFWSAINGTANNEWIDSYSGIGLNIAKYGIAAQLIKHASGKIAPYILSSVAKELKIEGKYSKSAQYVFRMMRRNTIEGIDAAILAEKNNMIGKMKIAKGLSYGKMGYKLMGGAAKALNIMGGVSMLVDVASMYASYDNSLKEQFRRNAMSHETAYSYIPEIPQATTERQRAIEAIQSSSMNLRNFIGNEGSMMHSV